MQVNISAVILAGGQGRRVGYRDKGLLIWRDKPLISRVIDCIEPQVDQLMVNCNRNTEDYQQLGYPIYQDQWEDFQGPLAGVLAAYPLLKSDLCLFSPCDMPLLPKDLVSRLLAAIQLQKADIAYPRCGDRQHYLPMLVRTQTLTTLDAYLNSGERSVKGWYASKTAIAVDFSDKEECFSNMNSPGQLHQNAESSPDDRQ